MKFQHAYEQLKNFASRADYVIKDHDIQSYDGTPIQTSTVLNDITPEGSTDLKFSASLLFNKQMDKEAPHIDLCFDDEGLLCVRDEKDNLIKVNDDKFQSNEDFFKLLLVPQMERSGLEFALDSVDVLMVSDVDSWKYNDRLSLGVEELVNFFDEGKWKDEKEKERFDLKIDMLKLNLKPDIAIRYSDVYGATEQAAEKIIGKFRDMSAEDLQQFDAKDKWAEFGHQWLLAHKELERNEIPEELKKYTSNLRETYEKKAKDERDQGDNGPELDR